MTDTPTLYATVGTIKGVSDVRQIVDANGNPQMDGRFAKAQGCLAMLDALWVILPRLCDHSPDGIHIPPGDDCAVCDGRGWLYPPDPNPNGTELGGYDGLWWTSWTEVCDVMWRAMGILDA
jgi:hypothetical protein